MPELHFRVWYRPEKKMYERGCQKWFHVLLCERDPEAEGEVFRPVKKASYDDCVFLEGTGIHDLSGREIYEGDIVEVLSKDKCRHMVIGPVADMYRSRGLHPLQESLDAVGIPASPELQFRIIGNEYEDKQKKTF